MKPVELLLISRDAEQAEILLKQLSSSRTYLVHHEKNAAAILNRLRNSPIEILVMNLEYFGPTQLQLVEQMRGLKINLKVLIIVDRVNQNTSAKADKIPNMYIFKKYFFNLDKDFTGILKRIRTEGKITKRTSKRHATQQAAMIKVARTGKMFKANVCNLSTTGAHLEYEAGVLNLSDDLQIIISLGELKKTHIIKCKIAWLHTDATAKKSAGLIFSNKP